MKRKFIDILRKNLKKALLILSTLVMTAAVILTAGISAFAEETIAACPYSGNYILARQHGSHTSINDLMDMDIGLILVSMLVVVFIIAFFSYKKMKNNLNNVYGEGQGGYETQKVSAKVISKTTANLTGYRIQINYLTFELENGERKEFAIRNESTFRSIVENDKGILTYCGKAFISFERD